MRWGSFRYNHMNIIQIEQNIRSPSSPQPLLVNKVFFVVGCWHIRSSGICFWRKYNYFDDIPLHISLISYLLMLKLQSHAGYLTGIHWILLLSRRLIDFSYRTKAVNLLNFIFLFPLERAIDSLSILVKFLLQKVIDSFEFCFFPQINSCGLFGFLVFLFKQQSIYRV